MSDKLQLLFKEVKKAQTKSYSPYSHFAVGCVLELEDGTFIQGANIENASYGACICAERSAMCNKLVHDSESQQRVVSVAIVGPTTKCITPCGICRQFLSEFLPGDTVFILFNSDGTNHETTSLEQLFPNSFAMDGSNI